MMIDITSNVLFLIADAVIFLNFRKHRTPVAFAGFLAAGGALAVFSSPVLGGGAFGMMRVMAWAIFVHGIVLLVGGAILLRTASRRTAIAAGAVALLIAIVGVDAFFVEPHALQVTRIRIRSSKLNRPLRIAIVADLQTDEVGPYERAALALAKSENPHLVLFAGDYLQEHDDARRAKLIPELKKALKEAGFRDLRGALAVEGNCDSDDWPAIFEGTGIAATKETRTIRDGDLQITALSLNDSFDPRLSVEPSNLFHIAVGHAPDYALGNVQADLLVAGHTHGGQVRLPLIGPLITLSSVPRSWAAGMTELSGGRTLIVSRGIGLERGNAPRLRFLCRPELVIVEVVPTE